MMRLVGIRNYLFAVLITALLPCSTWAATREDQPPAPRTITNKFGMTFVEIPAGEFMMGSEKGAPNERPHKVRISYPFFLGVTEVTSGDQYAASIAAGQAAPSSGMSLEQVRLHDLPTPFSSWDKANQFAKTISELDPEYDYRLPTEAEWEYAGRGQTDAFDNSRVDQQVSQAIELENSWKREPSNAFGLYDMLWNLGEYCSDWYSPDYY